MISLVQTFQGELCSAHTAELSPINLAQSQSLNPDTMGSCDCKTCMIQQAGAGITGTNHALRTMRRRHMPFTLFIALKACGSVVVLKINVEVAKDETQKIGP